MHSLRYRQCGYARHIRRDQTRRIAAGADVGIPIATRSTGTYLYESLVDL